MRDDTRGGGPSSLLRALGFWIREIWTAPWDHDRRVLLVKHYLSYLRFPPLPARLLPELQASSCRDQVSFSNAYARRLVEVQTTSPRSRGVHLTFRPLGKNLRLLGSAIRGNVDRDCRTVIEPTGPDSEIRDLRAKGREWSPWLWSRGVSGGGTPELDAGAAWATFFRRPDRVGDSFTLPSTPVPRLRVSEAPFTRRHLERILKLAAATSYAFAPVDSILLRVVEQQRRLGWPDQGERILGLHVRRGDAAAGQLKEYTAQNSTRASFALEAYLEGADLICAKYGIRHIFLATESKDEIERARRMRPQYTFLHLDHDRSIFPDLATSPQFIEDAAFEHPERARPLAESAIFDLHCFRSCHAFIGTFNSEFSLLAWLLAIGRQGHLVPYISLSEASRRRSLHPMDALLNLRNNCPLELYHW